MLLGVVVSWSLESSFRSRTCFMELGFELVLNTCGKSVFKAEWVPVEGLWSPTGVWIVETGSGEEWYHMMNLSSSGSSIKEDENSLFTVDCPRDSTIPLVLSIILRHSAIIKFNNRGDDLISLKIVDRRAGSLQDI